MSDQSDAELLREIGEETDPRETVNKVHAFYADADRADRTDRAYLYYHLGLLSGLILRLLDRHVV